jgi:transmembrane sensor
MVLPDGSRLTLGAASAASVAFTEGARRIVLHGGRAHFDVSRDPARPFVVAAGRGEARVLGTVFQVARAGDGARIAVAEGRVEVAASGGRTRLAAGDEAGYDGDGRLSAVRAVDPAAETAWLRGRAIFDRRPLRDVIAAVAPYHAGRIVILTDRAAALEVTGVFDLADVDALLRAVERSLPVAVTRLPLLTAIR